MVLQNVGCPACKADDCNALSEKTKKIVAAKARTSYPAYIEYLKSEYGTEITVLADPSTFRMNYEQLHRCCHGHEWKISPKLLKRYRNGCPYCMTHTGRTAKQVLLNIGHI